jgi:thiol-disulfide isomerase/thioredoxin
MEDLIAMLNLLLVGLVSLMPLAAAAGQVTELAAISAPELGLPDVSGKLHTLADLRGRVVLVNFWASWCRPCVAEMPSLKQLAARFADRPFTLLAVNSGDGRAVVERFIKQQGLAFPVLLDEPGDQSRVWRIRVLPTSYLVDPGGHLRMRYLGPYDWSSQEAADQVEQLIGGASIAPRSAGSLPPVKDAVAARP